MRRFVARCRVVVPPGTSKDSRPDFPGQRGVSREASGRIAGGDINIDSVRLDVHASQARISVRVANRRHARRARDSSPIQKQSRASGPSGSVGRRSRPCESARGSAGNASSQTA